MVTVTINGVDITGAPLEYLTADPEVVDGRFWVRTDLIGAAAPNAPSPSIEAGDGENTLTWADVPGASSYNIYWLTGATDPTIATGTKITGATSPYAHTDLTNGTVYRYVVTAQNTVGESPASTAVNATPVETTKPEVTAFTVGTVTSLTVAVDSFTATDNIGVTGYLITESATPPASGAAGWTGTAPATYTTIAAGEKTLYPWAKDAAGNVSEVFSTPRTVTFTAPAYFDTDGAFTSNADLYGRKAGATASINVASGVCTLATASTSTDGAILVRKTLLTLATAKVYSFRARKTAAFSATEVGYFLCVANAANESYITPLTNTNYTANAVNAIILRNDGLISYKNSAATSYYFNWATGAWGTGVPSPAETLPDVNTYYWFELHNNGTSWWLEIWNADRTTQIVTTTAYKIAWANTVQTKSAGNFGIFCGDIITDFFTAHIDVSRYSEA